MYLSYMVLTTPVYFQREVSGLKRRKGTVELSTFRHWSAPFSSPTHTDRVWEVAGVHWLRQITLWVKLEEGCVNSSRGCCRCLCEPGDLKSQFLL